jgi:hypothetical protein
VRGDITEPDIVDAADFSVIETVEAFVRFRAGFHGDTGMRDYLYHRLMTNLRYGGTHRRTDGGGTLLVQAEWYTGLLYCNTGVKSSPGRFDLGIPKLEELHSQEPLPLVTFECGRNKNADDLLWDMDAAEEHEDPYPADITKLAREMWFKGLPYGYALEFYDEDHGEADELVRRLSLIRRTDLPRVVVLVCIGGRTPILTFFPDPWERRIRQRFGKELELIERLPCATVGAQRTAGAGGHHVTKDVFFSEDCSNEARGLVEAIEQHFGRQVRLVFGGKTMTVNRRPNGILLRIEKDSNSISDLDQGVSRELAAQLHLSIRPSYKIDGTQTFYGAVITAVGRVLQENRDFRPCVVCPSSALPLVGPST